MTEENKMRNIEIEKIVLNCGATEDKLEKSTKLLNIITGKKIKQTASVKRIPSFGVRPGLKTGCMVTLRNIKDGLHSYDDFISINDIENKEQLDQLKEKE